MTGNTSGAGGGGIVTGTIGSGPVGVMTLKSGGELEHRDREQGGGGGGILNHAGTLTLNSSTVDHNTAPGGGGIASGTGSGNAEGGSLVTLNKSVISDNSSSAASSPVVAGSLTAALWSSTAARSRGTLRLGAPAAVSTRPSATLNKTVVSGNTALDDTLGNTGICGGIANFNFGISRAPASTLVLNNSTVTGNAVSEDGIGGGLANPDFFGPGFVALNHTDISGNTRDNCFPPGTITGCTG